MYIMYVMYIIYIKDPSFRPPFVPLDTFLFVQQCYAMFFVMTLLCVLMSGRALLLHVTIFIFFKVKLAICGSLFFEYIL